MAAVSGVAVLVAASGMRATAEPDEAFQGAHDALLARDDLQFEFSILEIPPIEPRREIGWLADFLAFIAPAMTVIFWGMLAAIAAFVLYFILREFVFVRFAWGRPKDKAKAEVQDYRPAPEMARALLSDADRLADEGRFADAVRLLLHRSIQDIEEQRGGLSRALTSREIAVHPKLSDRSRPPFMTIARVVEQGFFGGQAIGAADFGACRDAYARFALPEGAA